MYSILKNLFDREQNENYRSGNRSTFAQGMADLRNGWAAMQNNRKNRRDQEEYKRSIGKGSNNQTSNVSNIGGQVGGTLAGNTNQSALGAWNNNQPRNVAYQGLLGNTGKSAYTPNYSSVQEGGGIGANANGVYGVTPASNSKYTFNEQDYIPNEKNGYHINDNPRMAEWGHPQDYQRQMVRNALRDVYEGTDWYKLPYTNYTSATAKAVQPQAYVDRYPQELVGLTGEDLQRAALAYNQRIDNGYNNFGQAIQNAENAVAPQVAPTVQPIVQPTNPPVNNSSSVADFKRYDSGQGSGANSVADFKRNNSGYSAPMTEVPDPSIQYPTVASQVNKQQVVPQQSSGYKPITDFYDYNKQVRENYYPQGVQYVKDPNNPSFVDKIVDWYRGL